MLWTHVLKTQAMHKELIKQCKEKAWAQTNVLALHEFWYLSNSRPSLGPLYSNPYRKWLKLYLRLAHASLSGSSHFAASLSGSSHFAEKVTCKLWDVGSSFQENLSRPIWRKFCNWREIFLSFSSPHFFFFFFFYIKTTWWVVGNLKLGLLDFCLHSRPTWVSPWRGMVWYGMVWQDYIFTHLATIH